MSHKLIQGKTLTLKDAGYIASLLIACTTTYTMTANTASTAMALANENKAFGIARDKKIEQVREYARDYAYRKDAEQNKFIEKHHTWIQDIREENVETRVKLSHVVSNQERIIKLLEKRINNGVME